MNLSLEVLLVDDLSNMRRLMKNIIKNLGFKTIHEAGDGKEGLAVLESQDIGLIISDWNMPNMTGIEFLKRVRSSEKHKSTPFLMVTAEATRENIIEAIGAGASNYVVKPVQADIVEAKLKAILGKN
jgi:two-component system chemotaxis response regulator CheY